MRVCPMKPEELPDVVRLWHETRKDTYDFLADEAALTIEDSHQYFESRIAPQNDLWIAEDGGEILGYLAISGSYIDRLYVRPAKQRRGVGGALLEKARELSPDGLELHTHRRNRKACAFYEKSGFRAVRFGISPPPESEPDVEYHWRPAAPAACSGYFKEP